MDDRDDGVTRYRYYESDKVLGKLYRAIDERKIFQEMQARSRKDGDLDGSTLMYAVWEYVQKRCQLIQWGHKVEGARSLRDMCVLNPSNLRAVKLIVPLLGMKKDCRTPW